MDRATGAPPGPMDSLAHSPQDVQPDAPRLVRTLESATPLPQGPTSLLEAMMLDCRALRPEIPRLASPLVKRVAHEASPQVSSRGQRLSPVETKTLPSLAPVSSAPVLVRRLPSITRPQAAAPASVQAPESAAADERTIRDLAARLALLLHARECCKGSQRELGAADKGGERGCLIRNCGVARGVLDHCQECFLADGKCHVSCAQAKRLLRHFRMCRARGSEAVCRLCAVLHADFPWALHHAASLSPVYLRPVAKAEPTVRLCRVVSNESDCASRPAKRRR